MRILRIILIMVLGCIIPNNATAKDGKVKYAKAIKYKGGVSNKNPNGEGTLTVYSKVNGKHPLLTVSGIFGSEPNNDNRLSISNANISVTDGVKITAPAVSLSLNLAKDEETVKFDMPICKIADGDKVISLTENLSLLLNWARKGDKQWEYSINAPATGILYEKLLPVADIQARIDARGEEPIKQTVYFVTRYYPGDPEMPAAIDLLNVKDIDFNSGLKVTCNKYATEYSFSNGDYAKYGSDGICSNLKLTLPDGVISYDGKKLSINYSNGDRFEAKDFLDAGIAGKDVLNLQSLTPLKLMSGVYCNADGTNETYNNGQIVARKIAGGTISMGENSQFAITYDNGDTFTGIDRNFIKNTDDFLNFTSVTDALPNNGKLAKSSDTWDVYKGGIIVGGRWPLSDGGYVEYADNLPISVKYPDGSSVSGVFINNTAYKANFSSKEYRLKNGTKTDINGRTVNISNGEIQPSNLVDIRLMAREKGLSTAVDNRPLYYSCGSNNEDIITFDFFPEFKQLNDGYYYVPVNKEFGLSYPKSLIRKRVSGEIYVYTVRTNAITERLHYSDMQFVWVYQPHGTRFGNEYGITKALYLINRETDEVVDDLTQTIKSGNNRQFESVEKPRYKYHQRGKMENCPYCQGTGKIGYWDMGVKQYRFCNECGGKGWYIEHYW